MRAITNSGQLENNCSLFVWQNQGNFMQSNTVNLRKNLAISLNLMPVEKWPPVLEGVNSPLSVQGGVRYGTRFQRFSCSSSNFSMANAMLC